jgi:hypothetical protein
MAPIDMETFNKCMAKAREKLLNGEDRFCEKYGLKTHHIVPSKVDKVKAIMNKRILIGYSFSIMRHPLHGKMEQVWKVYFDGKLVLDHEIPLSGKAKRIPCQGQLIPRDKLWGRL